MARKRYCLLALIVSALVLASCSVVFEAGISGKVVTAEGTGTSNVQDVSVFAYTDSGLRDSDFAKFQEGTITRPTEGSGYVATTTTNANGEFTVNKVVWETKKSEFGKTADVSKLYLIFYHEDYKPAKADATVISGSTNSSNVYVKLEGSKDYTTINVTVYDVSTGRVLTDACTLEYSVEGVEGSDTMTMTGTGTFTISFPKDREKDPNVTIKLSSPGSDWKMTDKNGNVIEDDPDPIEDVAPGTLRVSLFMKSYSFTLPAFNGNIDGSLTALADPNSPYKAGIDNLPVTLLYYTTENEWKVFKETESAGNQSTSARIGQGDNVYYQHGLFSGVGNSENYSIIASSSLYPKMKFTDTGKVVSIRLRLAFKRGLNDFGVYEFDYSVLTESDLGRINLEDVASADEPIVP